jgi:TonB family protein
LLVHLVPVLILSLSPSLPGVAYEEVEIGDAGRPDFEIVDAVRLQDRRPDKEAHMLSVRNSLAADMNPEDFGPEIRPYSEGSAESDPVGPAVTRKEAEEGPGRNADREAGDLGLRMVDLDMPGRSVDYLSEMTSGRRSRSRGSLEEARNLVSSARRRGGFSFSTYDWEFAPYMLAMKRAVESHMYPPYAFTHMGLITGSNVVRFVVDREGRVRNLRVMDSDAHYSLDGTSLQAVQLSVPFAPLPEDFPGDSLEVTARFAYVIQR